MSIYRLLLLMTLNLFQVEMRIAQLKPVRRIIRCERRKICHLTDDTQQLPRRVVKSRDCPSSLRNMRCFSGMEFICICNFYLRLPRRVGMLLISPCTKKILTKLPRRVVNEIKLKENAICPAGLEKK